VLLQQTVESRYIKGDMASVESLLFESPVVRIIDYRCHEQPNSMSSIEVSERVEITYTRTGHFLFRGHKEEVVVDNTLLLLHNEGSERRVSHDKIVRDTCTIFQFSKGLLADFLFPVAAIPVTPRLDYLHSQIFGSLTLDNPPPLRIDILSTHFLEETLGVLSKYGSCPSVSDSVEIRGRHRDAIERAKNFILRNFTRDLTLSEIARNAYISEFHFSRLFQKITSRSPHQFLLDVRFQHAALLLRETSLPVTEICYASGFNNLPHFIAAFTRRHRISPLRFRKSKNS
jgi:AraC family transcriptional regulator